MIAPGPAREAELGECREPEQRREHQHRRNQDHSRLAEPSMHRCIPRRNECRLRQQQGDPDEDENGVVAQGAPALGGTGAARRVTIDDVPDRYGTDLQAVTL